MSKSKRSHWSTRSADDLRYKISADFLMFIEKTLGDDCTQADLAKRLGVSEGRVSQVLNNPNSLSLKSAVMFARAVGANVALVAYRDDSEDGSPVPAEIFTKCWEHFEKPRDFFEFEERAVSSTSARYTDIGVVVEHFPIRHHAAHKVHFSGRPTRHDAFLQVTFAREVSNTRLPMAAGGPVFYEPRTSRWN